MSRAQREIDEMAVQTILHAALRRFHLDGYQGTSMRDIAAEAHMSVKALRDHFPSKQAILVEIADATHDGALAQTEAAVAEAGEDPAERLEAAVWAQCDFYARHPRGCLVAGLELRSLEAEPRDRVIAKIRRQQRIFDEIVFDGAVQGAFDVDAPRVVSRAVFNLCSAIPMSVDITEAEPPRKVAQAYCDLVSRMTGAVSRA
jgi:AcrR family transcriptional regulator